MQQVSAVSVTLGTCLLKPKKKKKRKYTVNATEIARNKFNALFADHDAKDTRAASHLQKPTLKTVNKGSKEERQATMSERGRVPSRLYGV
jgi:hypothetical protein